MHQHARFFPRNTGRHCNISRRRGSRSGYLSVSPLSHIAKSSTARACVHRSSTRNGFPNLCGRATLKVLSGIAHPFLRDKEWRTMRFSKSPSRRSGGVSHVASGMVEGALILPDGAISCSGPPALNLRISTGMVYPAHVRRYCPGVSSS